MNQQQMYYQSVKRTARTDSQFFEMVNHPTNPLTNSDLKTLVERFPERWSRYAGFIGKLSD